MRPGFGCLLLHLLAIRHVLGAITLDLTSTDSVKQAAKTVAYGMMQYYTGNQTGQIPGNLPPPYFWWEAGAMFGALVDYWYFTGDDEYNGVTTQALLFQVGPNNDFMPPNQTNTEGNDDQSFWAMAALSAAENRFPNPPSNQPQWLALAQAVFNLQAARWDTTTCGGGLRWQIFAFNGGYTYKNTISNGCFFNIGARLAVYTGNNTYADWARKAWDWCEDIGLFDSQYNFWDGSDSTINCTQMDHLQWTYNPGTFLVGAANMYNYTNGSVLWENRIRGIIGNLPVFYANNTQIVSEIMCEPTNTCDADQKSFKAYLVRWMAATMVRAPFTYPLLKPLLETWATAAVSTCTGGPDGNQCGEKWYTGSFDGSMGVGQQMCALEVIQSNLVDTVAPPATANRGGISPGNPAAGTGGSVGPSDLNNYTLTWTDQAGAYFMTAGIALFVITAACWICR